VSVDIAYTTKELYGSRQFPLAIGRGTAKITGKAQFGQFNAQAFNDIFFGESSLATGETVTIVNESATVTANAIAVSHNSGFASDLGVSYQANGVILTRVAAGANAGQYACNESTGNYTFNAADNNTAMYVSYTYADAANGKSLTLTNQLLGSAPQFSVVLTETFNAKKLTLQLNACMTSQLTLATKLEDFTIPDFTFQAFADASGNIGKINVDE